MYYFLNDLNSVYAIFDSQGSVLERYLYSPYGILSVLDSSGSFQLTQSQYAISWTFTGRRHDHDTGLMYYRFRMYDTHLGRFISRDPPHYISTRTTRLSAKYKNTYTYANDTPTKYVDIYGLEERTPPPAHLSEPIDLNGEPVGRASYTMYNCLGHALGIPGAMDLVSSTSPITNLPGTRDRAWGKVTRPLRPLMEALGYDCKQNISPNDCDKHCACKPYLMLYLYIRPGTDKNTKDNIKATTNVTPDPLSEWLVNNEGGNSGVDYHALRGTGGTSYTQQFGMMDKDKANITSEKELNDNALNRIFGSTDNIIGGYCCCKNKNGWAPNLNNIAPAFRNPPK
jgi:RHS repeat-associated protein